MKNFTATIFCIFLCIGNIAISQNTEHLKAINTDLWENFNKSFETLDYELFSSLHCDDLIRINADSKSVKDKSEYLEGYKKRWATNQINQTISFRFLERICDNDKASERGIYRLIRNQNTQSEQSYYGKFHVILKKEGEKWKILVDYDSSENNTINEDSYQQAFDMNEFEKYQN